jgi:PAS domain S-box-containing protein
MRNEIWASDQWRALVGFSSSERLDLEKILQRVHPDDRETVSQALVKATEGNGRYETEYRLMLPDGQLRWVASHGRIEFNRAGKPVVVRGVSLNITARKQAELEVQQQRGELAHLSRVTMLGELSGSLAHELNQPLTAILSNAQAAQRFLAHDHADLNEVRDILADIVAEDKRAGEVIRRLRLLLKKGEVQHQPFDLNEVVREVLKLVRSDLVNQGVAAHAELAPALPAVNADRVQLQQVLLNLVMNACDAMAGGPAGDRKLIIRTGLAGGEGIRVSVADRGVGLAPDKLEKVFEPFFTTKVHGMGLGLSVCRTIITAHGGKLWTANNPERGATFHFTLPASTEANP